MKTLVRKNTTYRLNDLPKVKSSVFTFNNVEGCWGSIIMRPLDGTPAWHYGFVYGFDESDTLWMIENNENGVECVTWEDFISGTTQFQISYYEKDPQRFKEIMGRANERANEAYSLSENNCEHFVNYCVDRRHESAQVKVVKSLVDKLVSLLEMKLVDQTDPVYYETLEDFNDFREHFNIKREYKPLQQLIDKKLKTS